MYFIRQTLKLYLLNHKLSTKNVPRSGSKGQENISILTFIRADTTDKKIFSWIRVVPGGNIQLVRRSLTTNTTITKIKTPHKQPKPMMVYSSSFPVWLESGEFDVTALLWLPSWLGSVAFENKQVFLTNPKLLMLPVSNHA